MSALDVGKAFDSPPFKNNMISLHDHKIRGKLFNIIKYGYSNNIFNVCYEGIYGKTFTSSRGYEQGTVGSGLTYACYTNKIEKKLIEKNCYYELNGKKIPGLIFADDTNILSQVKQDEIENITSGINVYNNYLDNKYLKPNEDKSSYIKYGFKKEKEFEIKLNDKKLKNTYIARPLAWPLASKFAL